MCTLERLSETLERAKTHMSKISLFLISRKEPGEYHKVDVKYKLGDFFPHARGNVVLSVHCDHLREKCTLITCDAAFEGYSRCPEGLTNACFLTIRVKINLFSRIP